MPVLVKASDLPRPAADSPARVMLIDKALTKSDFCEVSRVTVPAGATFDGTAAKDAAVWFQVLSGEGRVNGQPIDDASVVFARPGTALSVEAGRALDLLWTVVPRAERFDAALGNAEPGIVVTDWTREPVLQSEHDSRTRTYVATEGLTGTWAIKAEIITYPPGGAAPEHHHEGAEHFQFILSGRGTAVLNGVEAPLEAGDVLYNYENELHYFFTDPDAGEDFVFVEFFIPGQCLTVWAAEAKACAWLPTGKDSRGSVPVRDIGYHVHGQDTGI
jgi:quercetin dioxygenase-like cupin family protein